MGMKLLLTGGCGFIGSAVVRHLLRRTGHAVVNVDKMTYAASEEALEEAPPPQPPRADPRRHRRRRGDAPGLRHPPAGRRDAPGGREPRGPLDRRPGRFVQTNVVGTFTLLEAARAYCAGLDARPPRRVPLPPRLHRRGVRRARPRRSAVHRDHRLRSAQPLFGQQGRVGPSGARLAPHLRAAGHRQQHLQQLRPLAVPGEADPAGHAERAGGQGAAGLRRRLQPPRLAVRRGPRRGAGPRRWSAASPAPPTRSAPASRAATSTWCARSAPCWTAACPTRPARARA